MCETPDAQACSWNVPVNADHARVKANGVDPRFLDQKGKKVSAVEMSCPWVEDSGKRRMRRRQLSTILCGASLGSDTSITSTSVKIIVIDVLGGWSMELERSDYEKASWCKGKGCFANNAESHNLVLAQHSTYFKFSCSLTD